MVVFAPGVAVTVAELFKQFTITGELVEAIEPLFTVTNTGVEVIGDELGQVNVQR